VAFGGGYMLGVTVTLETHSSTRTSVLSFDQVKIDRGHKRALLPAEICDVCNTSAPAGVNGPATALTEMRFWGRGLGAYDYSPAVRLGLTGMLRYLRNRSVSLLACRPAGPHR